MPNFSLPNSLTDEHPWEAQRYEVEQNFRALKESSLNESNSRSAAETNLQAWRVDINPLTVPSTQTNWSTLQVNTAQMTNGYLQSSGAQNAEIGWDVTLSAGTWSLSVLGAKSSNLGIITASIDGTSIGTMDQYQAPALTPNLLFSVVGFTATAGKKRLLLKMATKNASSSSYFGLISVVTLQRTA